MVIHCAKVGQGARELCKARIAVVADLLQFALQTQDVGLHDTQKGPLFRRVHFGSNSRAVDTQRGGA